MSHGSAIRRVLIALALGSLLAGCERTNRWQEDVQLSDGTVLQVSRVVHYRAPSGPLGQPSGRRALEEHLSFADSGTGRDVEWHQPRRTAVWLDRIESQVWIVARLSTPCESGFGHLPVWQAYVLRVDQWREVEPADLPVVAVRNLLTTDDSITKRLRHVSLSDKQRLNARYLSSLHYAIDLGSQSGC